MGCFIHKWDGCVCRKCGKTRKVRHNFKCGKCTVCGAVDESKGHGDRRNWDHRLNGSDVEFFCRDCGRVMKTVDYYKQLRDTEQEIRNAEDAGCDSPVAESLLYWLRKHTP